MNKLRKLSVITLSILLGLTSTINVKADEGEIYKSDDGLATVKVTRTRDEEGLSITLHADEESETEVQSIQIDEDQAEKLGSHTFMYHVGAEGNYKVTVVYSNDELLEEQNRQFTFELKVNEDELYLDEADEASDEELEFYFPDTDTVEKVNLSQRNVTTRGGHRVTAGASISGPGVRVHWNKDPSFFWSSGATGYESLFVDGRVAYCIEPMVSPAATNNASATPLDQVNSGKIMNGYSHTTPITRADKNLMTLYANYGYGYPGHNTNNYRWAVQKLVWGIRDHTTTGGNNVDKEMNEIKRLVSLHGKQPSWNNTTKRVSKGDIIDLSGELMSTYDVTESKGLTVTQHSGNTFKVRVDDPANASLVLHKKQGIKTGTSIVYSDGYSQKVSEFKLSDPVRTTLKFEPAAGTINMEKKDNAGRPVADTVFELSSNKSSIIGTYTTGSDGKVSAPGIEAGKYFIREKSVPSPIIIDKTWKPVTVTAGKTVNFTAVNDVAMGKVQIKKLSADGGVVQGTKYEVRRADGGVVDTITTNAQGLATSKELPLGQYNVVEIFTPAPLLLDQTPIKVNIKYADQETPVVVETATQTNKVARGTISVNKTSTSNDNVVGAMFVVKDADGKIVSRLTTNDSGFSKTEPLPLGSYTLTEVYTPAPHVLDPTPVKVDLVYKDQHTAVVNEGRNIVNEYQRSTIAIKKVENDWDEIFPELNGQSLAGAHMDVFAAEDIYEGSKLVYKKDAKIANGVTNDKGEIIIESQPLGKYYAVETKAPEGFKPFTGRWNIELKYDADNAETKVTTTNKVVDNEVIYGKARLVKHDEKWTLLPGATFGVFTKDGQKITELKSNFAGRIITPELRYGEYYFQEIEAPEGYWLDSTKLPFTISEQDEIVEMTAPNYKIKARLFVHKVDSETKLPLEGAKFKLWDVQNDDWVSIKYAEGKEVVVKDEWVTDEDGEFLMEGTIPYGKYKLIETEAPEGYNLADPIEINIDKDQDYVEMEVIGVVLNQDVENRPIRSDIAVAKVDKNTGEYLPGFKFKLTNLANDEETVITTDENGIALFEQFKYGRYMVEEIEVAGEYLIDKTPQFVDIIEDSIVYELTFENEKPLGELELTKVDFKDFTPIADAVYGLYDIQGNLVMDGTTNEDGVILFEEIELGEYYVQEIESPKGYVLDEKQYFISVDYIDDVTPVIELDLEIKEWRNPEIGTTASFVERDEKEPVIVTLVDEVRYENLHPGQEYVVEGFLMNKDTNEPIIIDGEKVTGKTVFKPEAIDGKVNVEFTFDQSKLETDTVVVFEDLYKDGIKVAFHHDIKDVEQTVEIPDIGTSASFVEVDDKEPNIATIVDVVKYENLIVGKEYTVSGFLMDKETNEPIIIDGKKVEGSTTFTPEKSNGTVDVEFTLDLNELETETIVVFEDMHSEGRLIAVHHDINDEEQTVEIPKVGTEASFVESDKKQPEMITIVDEVRYDNLIIGKEYTVNGHLMDKETNEPVIIDGKKVEGSTTFIAKEQNGIVEVEFTFDRTKLETKTVVVFEDLFEEDRLVAVHRDINDVEQTVEIPDIGTTASFVERDKEEVNIVTIVDEVRYENLIVGDEYVVNGHLMDKETGEPVIIDGKKVEGSTTFVAEEPNGSVEVTFTFDQSKLKTQTVVVFEDLYQGERLIAFHHDINDVEQTVEIPEIGTTASFVERDEEEVNIVTIADEVRYEGLTVGKEYTVNGHLMDKETGEPVIIDGERVEGSTTFIAEESNGTVEVKFTFDQNKLKTKTIVVFEELYEGERLIAVHTDLEDEAQTVELIDLKVVKKDAKDKTPIEGVEFTLYDENGRILDKQLTDNNGELVFRVFRGENLVIKETSTPEGYIEEDITIAVNTNEIEGNTETFEVLNTPIAPEKPTGDMRAVPTIAVVMTMVSALWLFTRKRYE